MPKCSVCNEEITQPLCVRCLELQMSTWLQERYPARPELLFMLHDRAEELGFLGGAATCIKCNRPMNVCGQCFTEHVYDWIVRRLPESSAAFRSLFGLYPYGEESRPLPPRAVPT